MYPLTIDGERGHVACLASKVVCGAGSDCNNITFPPALSASAFAMRQYLDTQWSN